MMGYIKRWLLPLLLLSGGAALWAWLSQGGAGVREVQLPFWIWLAAIPLTLGWAAGSAPGRAAAASARCCCLWMAGVMGLLIVSLFPVGWWPALAAGAALLLLPALAGVYVAAGFRLAREQLAAEAAEQQKAAPE